MKFDTRIWPEQPLREHSFGAKAIIRAETPEELVRMQALADVIGIEIDGGKLEIVWSWPRIDRNRTKLAARRAAPAKGRVAAAALDAGG